MSTQNLLLETNRGNVYRVTAELSLTRKIKRWEITDWKGEKVAAFSNVHQIQRRDDFKGSDLAHITQGFNGQPSFSSYAADEKILRVYVGID